MTVGELTAESDGHLDQVFLPKQSHELVLSFSNNRGIVVGRTGAGKTALLKHVEGRTRGTGARAVRIDPDALSLRYISNSTLIPSLYEAGLHLDLFYRWLWRHVILVELINEWASNRPQEEKEGFFNAVFTVFKRRHERDKRDREASEAAIEKIFEYSNRWDGQFFQLEQLEFKEVNAKLDRRLQSGLGARYGSLTGQIKADSGEEYQVSERTRERAQAIVNEVQIDDLKAIINLVKTQILQFSDQKPFYVLIDDLDLDWVEDRYANDLIAALLQEIREFSKLPNVKILVAIRENIVAQIVRRPKETRGWQREKFEDFIVDLRWTPDDLKALIQKRLDQLRRPHYMARPTVDGVLPSKKSHGQVHTGWSFIVERTHLRPRQVIKFFNDAIAAASAKGLISWESMKQAERAFSEHTAGSLYDEWKENWPGIDEVIQMLEGMPDGFDLSDGASRLYSWLDSESDGLRPGTVGRQLFDLYCVADHGEVDLFTETLLPILYEIGVLGVKRSPNAPIVYSHEPQGNHMPRPGPETKVYFHPSLYKWLDISTPRIGGRLR